MSDRDSREMLAALGISEVSELFSDVPEGVREGLSLPRGLGEHGAVAHVDGLLAGNAYLPPARQFVGHGAYHHHVPAFVRRVISRGELLTAYTPYQPEISQGMLQALYEYQSLACELTGLPATNSSMYDIATAAAESLIMSVRATRKGTVLIPEALSEERRQVIRTYTAGPGIKVLEYPFDRATGQTDWGKLRAMASDDVAGIYIESPNLFGLFEEGLDELRSIFPKSLLILGTDPIALSVMKSPADLDFDVAVANGQVLGNPVAFGGPHLGIFTCKAQHMRTMPGRVIGKTTDRQGRRSFVMTLQTREQHIRRERATSNICTNNALCAVAFAAHLSVLGAQGLARLARENMTASKLWADHLAEVDGLDSPVWKGHYFNDFPVRADDPSELISLAEERGYILGVPLERDVPALKGMLLTCATEVNSEEEMRTLMRILGRDE